MPFFRKHYKTFVWVMIVCFLAYLIPSVVLISR